MIFKFGMKNEMKMPKDKNKMKGKRGKKVIE